MYAFLGGCREVTIGPTALLALMTSRHTGLGGVSGPHLAILLCFFSGIVECLMAVLRLGALVDLISLPVTVGFTSATAVIIGVSQLKGLLGFTGGGGSSFMATIATVLSRLDEIRTSDAALGICSIGILLLLRVRMLLGWFIGFELEFSFIYFIETEGYQDTSRGQPESTVVRRDAVAARHLS